MDSSYQPVPWYRRDLGYRAWIVLYGIMASPLLVFMAIFIYANCVTLVIIFYGSLAAIYLMLRWHGDWPLIGPHFFYDIITLARRGRNTSLRIVYLLALLVGLGYIYHENFGEPGQFWRMLFAARPGITTYAMSTFALKYVDLIVFVQNLAVLLLTPAHLAAAITVERERRTLELLFTSHITDREIVLGKLTARLVHLGGILLAGLPVLCLARLLGGISMEVLLANFVNTALLLGTVGSLSIFMSVRSATALAAVLRSYGVVLMFFVSLRVIFGWSFLIISQQGFAGKLEDLWFAVAGRLLVHGPICLGFLTVAVRDLRRSPNEVSREFTGSARRKPTELIFSPPIILPKSRPPLPDIGDDPLIWKETYTGGQRLVFNPVVLLVAGGLLFVPLSVLSADTFRSLLRWIVIASAWLYCLSVGLRACASIALEKQQGTLDGLLTLPITTRDILQAKWMGTMRKEFNWAWVYVPLLSLGAVCRAIDFGGVIALIAAPFAFASFFACLGLYFSVVSRTVLSAQIKLGIVVLAFLTMALLGPVAGLTSPWLTTFNDNMNPLTCWNLVNDYPEQVVLQKYLQTAAWITACSVLYFLVGQWMWILACRAFAREWRG